jgi:uncharacterized protein YecE (DUF72 family)
MKFGAVPENRLTSIDLSLPKEPFINELVLTGARAADPKVYIGGARWGDNSWVGKIFPAQTPASRFRQLYPQHFSAIELNATYYKIYSPAILSQWATAAKGRDFKFCPKFPKEISHQGSLTNAGAITKTFLESLQAFENNLGPVFLQLSENFSPAQKNVLYHYLGSLPKGFNFFLELRHPSWFADIKEREDLFTTLRELKIGAVITDAPGRRDAAHMYLTVPKLFVRFVCNSLHLTSFSRANDWVQHLQKWIELGLEEAYIFLHPGNDKAIPDLASYWTKEINLHCRLQLPDPYPAQNTLFNF